MYAVTVLVTVSFSYLALRGVDFKEAWRGLRSSDWWWLAPALLAFGLGNLARGLRWRALFSPARRPPRGTTMNAMMIGYLYNNILPSRAGEAARIYVLRQRSCSPPVEITGTVALERIYDVVAILLIFFVAEPWLPHVSWFGTAALLAIALLGAIALVVAALAIYEDRPVRLVLRPLWRLSLFKGKRLERTVAEVAHGLAGLRHPRVAFQALAWTLLAWLMSILCAYLVTRALHLQVPFSASVLVMVAIALSMILPAPPAAVGVFEGATLIALHAYGVDKSIALPYALVLHLVNFVPFLLVGAPLLWYNSRHPNGRGAWPAPAAQQPTAAPSQQPALARGGD
jgi:uncharacterized protein (TIRG00374 family)